MAVRYTVGGSTLYSGWQYVTQWVAVRYIVGGSTFRVKVNGNKPKGKLFIVRRAGLQGE